jgi:hypothetical protein
MFNDGCFWEQAKSGKLRAVLMTEKHPSPQRSGHPFCTLSQTLAYFDEQDQEVARVHQYKLPDGTLGASGRPDPKRLLINGIIYQI